MILLLPTCMMWYNRLINSTIFISNISEVAIKDLFKRSTQVTADSLVCCVSPFKMLLLKLLTLCVFFFFVSCDTINNEIDDECHLSDELLQEIHGYETTVNTIINSLTNGKFKGQTYNELATFVDKFGARLSGTKNLENAIDYMLDLLKKYDLENVHGEDVQVPHWLRGEEHGQLLSPRQDKIPVLALGSSVGTPDGGIEAEVIVVKSFDELAQTNVSEQVKGKILVFNEEYVSYGASVSYRSRGASLASKYGAVAALIRSVTPFSISTLHTGEQDYEEGIEKIPAASITVEHARMFQRMQDRGDKIVLRLNINTTILPESNSRNTIGEIVGESSPTKVVLVSGHLDSWDVGVGAMDDGGGAFISWYSLAVLKALGLRPRRTLRAVLWTAEEPGLYGAFAYNTTHFDELKDHVFVMESDEGTFTPLGLEYSAGTKGGCIIKEILKLLKPINATQAVAGNGGVGSDINIWTSSVIPGASLLNDNEKYFWFHHTQGDSMDVLDPDALDKATAVWATAAYIIADLTEDFPRELKDVDLDETALMQAIKKAMKNNL